MENNSLNRICEFCKENFKTVDTYRGRKKRTCSISCRAKLGARNSPKEHVECKICCTPFIISKHSIQKDGNFCSDKCRKKRYLAVCVICEKEYRTDRKGTKYCSDVCLKNGQKNTLVKCKCDCCGVDFERSSFTVTSNKRVFCSKKCKARQFSRENPNRYGSRWSRIRERKVKADDYTCNRCKKQSYKPYSINVHHIIPIEEFQNIDDANRLDNLETLCYECHMEHHNRGIL